MGIPVVFAFNDTGENSAEFQRYELQFNTELFGYVEGAFTGAKKGGRVYVACFNSQGHASGEVLFFDAEGAPETPKPKPKGEYVCPECQGPLKYFKLKKGRSAGSMCFACFESARHASGKPRFFDDADGVPVFDKAGAESRA